MSFEEKRDRSRWLLPTIAIWLVICTVFIVLRWQQIIWFSLGDTDDNLRLMQVRAWLNGQDWYDLRQYRLNPPEGANIHWSRLVDLPIAGIIMLFRPFVGGASAEYIAVATAPLLPLLAVMVSMSLVVRRLVGANAYIIPFVMLPCSLPLLNMFAPLRIDHHGWQLAMLALLMAGLVDPKARRGGLTAGIATALSMTIGVELIPYLALAGGAIGLRWVASPAAAPRLRSYGLSLAIGVALGYFIFASYANAEYRCDALTPVWLSTLVSAGGLLFLLSFMTTAKIPVRLAAAAGLALVLGAGFALQWPQCLGRLEGVSPELEALWLSHIREAKPIYVQNTATWSTVGFSALVGLIGMVFGWQQSLRTERAAGWLSLLLMLFASCMILLWQVRAGPAMQLMAIVGATMLICTFLPRLRASKSLLVRTVGVVAAFLVFSGLLLQNSVAYVTAQPKGAAIISSSNKANSQCGTIPSIAPISRLPKATIFTFVDLSPRLIALSHHSAIAGPYHRNGEAILDVNHAFRGTADEARLIIKKHAATLLLICPGSSVSTIYAAETPKGFYVQLSKGQVPSWLEPVTLPPTSPFKLWRVK
jgi:multisubunit Na+/H+ antiporter MnhB subunit